MTIDNNNNNNNNKKYDRRGRVFHSFSFVFKDGERLFTILSLVCCGGVNVSGSSPPDGLIG